MKHYPRIILVPLITISESRSVLSRSRIKQRDNLKLRIRRATLRAKISFIFFLWFNFVNICLSKVFTSVFGLYAWIPPIAEQAYYAPKMPAIMPMPNINNIMPFHSGGGGSAAYYSPIVFIIFASINVRQLESTFSNHAEQPPPPMHVTTTSRGK